MDLKRLRELAGIITEGDVVDATDKFAKRREANREEEHEETPEEEEAYQLKIAMDEYRDAWEFVNKGKEMTEFALKAISGKSADQIGKMAADMKQLSKVDAMEPGEYAD